MIILRYVKRLIIGFMIILAALYMYDWYNSYQGTNRVSGAHTSIEQRIEKMKIL